jgi:hypothetical protein
MRLKLHTQDPQNSPGAARPSFDRDYARSPAAPWFQQQVLMHPQLMVAAFGALVFVTIFGMGLLFMGKRLIPFPWWLHGFLIALLTSLLASLSILWTVRKMEQGRDRELEQLRLAQNFLHHVGNALQVLINRHHITAAGRDRAVDDAVERIRRAMQEILPGIESAAAGEASGESLPEIRRRAQG